MLQLFDPGFSESAKRIVVAVADSLAIVLNFVSSAIQTLRCDVNTLNH